MRDTIVLLIYDVTPSNLVCFIISASILAKNYYNIHSKLKILLQKKTKNCKKTKKQYLSCKQNMEQYPFEAVSFAFNISLKQKPLTNRACTCMSILMNACTLYSLLRSGHAGIAYIHFYL